MKLSRTLTFLGLGISAVTAIALAAGCSSGGGGGTPPPVGQPPPSSGNATTSTEEHNFALRKLYLGDTDRMNVASGTAWKAFGYNLDGKVTTTASTDVCTLQPGAAKLIQVDGNSGIDNSFGENIVPIVLTTAGADSVTKINNAIMAGSFTIMLDITGLQDSNTSQTATGLSGILLAGGAYGADAAAPPLDTSGMFFAKTDDWPVRPDTLSNMMDPKSSTIKFPSAYVVNGTFVNGTPSDVTLNLAIGGVALDITVHHAIITFDHTTVGHALNGTIAGIINTTELITALQSVAGRISTSLCPPGQAFDSIAKQIQQASDIMADGTNGPGQACNGISIGIGFEADEIGIPDKVAPLGTPTPDPCSVMDAGGGG
jgi:hypothetical protein